MGVGGRRWRIRTSAKGKISNQRPDMLETKRLVIVQAGQLRSFHVCKHEPNDGSATGKPWSGRLRVSLEDGGKRT